MLPAVTSARSAFQFLSMSSIAALMRSVARLQPFCPLQFGWTLGNFVAIGHGDISQALAKCLQGKNTKALHAFIGYQGLVACDMGQIFDDDTAVINCVVMVGFENRNLAEG